jgi:hypothetical protein
MKARRNRRAVAPAVGRYEMERRKHQESGEPLYNLGVATHVPSKWLFIDLETGECYRGQGHGLKTPEPRRVRNPRLPTLQECIEAIQLLLDSPDKQFARAKGSAVLYQVDRAIPRRTKRVSPT